MSSRDRQPRGDTEPVLTAPGELVLILVRGDNENAAAVDSLSGIFGVGVLLADIGLIG